MWDCSLHHDVSEMFERYSQPDIERALEIAIAAYKARGAERYRDWYRNNKKQARQHADAWRRANPDRVRKIERDSHRRRVAKTPAKFRELWRQRKHRERTRRGLGPVRPCTCSACGAVGHNKRGCV